MQDDKPFPSDPHLLLKEAHRRFDEGKRREARALYRQLENIRPPDLTVLNRLADIACELSDWPDAEKWFFKSLAIAPDQPAALSNLGLVLQKSGRHEEALASYDRAIALKPGYAYAFVNRGFLLAELGRYEEAIASYDSAIAARPGFAGARFGKAEALLQMGDYPAGWELYESRWETKFKAPNPLTTAYPLWTGKEPVSGKSVLIHPEWGYGDFLMLARYIPPLVRRGANVVVCSPPALASVFRQLEGVRVVLQGAPLPHIDLQCPIMSLPRAFATTIATIPAEMPYLRVPPDKQASWREKLGAPARRRVGLMWAGTGNRNIDSNVARCRSLPLSLLESLLALPFEFHSLQKEIPANDMAALLSLGQVVTHDADLQDFADTAALIRQMDLVISIDTSVAHLAGALATPLWVLLPYACDYRWTSKGESTPWYPAARLFRQSSPGDWAGVVQRVADELVAFGSAK